MEYGIQNEMRERRCCFVGYTPEKLNRPSVLLKTKLREAVRHEIMEGHTTFVCGLEQGVEMWAAKIVLEEREKDSRIKLICLAAAEDCRTSGMYYDRQILMQEADCVRRLPAGSRKRWMIDRCGNLIAVYNGSRDGTKQAIDYAIRSRLNVNII